MEVTILQERKISLKKVISGTSLIAGTTIGAGMLGIPLVTMEAGFFPAACATIGVWIFMVLTGLLYVEVALSLPSGANIFSMSGHYLGMRGKIAAEACSSFSITAFSSPTLLGEPRSLAFC